MSALPSPPGPDDTAAAAAEDAAFGHGTSVGSSAARRWRRWRLLAVGLAVALGVATFGVLALPRTGVGDLDPDSPTPAGSRALAQVLIDRGVDVVRVVRVAAAVEASDEGTTLLVVEPDVLPPDLLDDLVATGANLVLVTPDATTLAATGAGLSPAGTTDDEVTEPGCADPDATAAGRALAGGHLYREQEAAGSTQVCFGASDAGSYAVWTGEGRRVTAVGQPQVLTNASLGDEGNAALALRSLGSTQRLVWLMASPLEGATGDAEDPTALLPRWVGWVALQLALVAFLAIVWRARRLGRLVPEPLPVVVRAAETALGRASLYRRAGARDRAAAVLRAASLRRLAARVGLASSATGPQVVGRAADAAGRPTHQIQHLLLGPPPADDHALTLLADELDTLERDVSSQ